MKDFDIKRSEIEQIIRSVLCEKFSDVEIESIEALPDVDEDGEKVIVVKVVFDGNRKKLDAKKVSGVARSVLPKLEEAGESGFPIMSFIAKSELRKKSPEAA